MFKRLTTTAVLTLLLAACAAGPPPEPPPPPPLDPTGTFNVEIDAEGTFVSGVMVIRGTAGEGYTGSIDTDMGGASLADIVVDGQTVSFSIPEVGADVELLFDDEGFTGVMGGEMGGASWIGTRREAG
jgi:hypothetical protein